MPPISSDVLIQYQELKDNPYSRKVRRQILIGGKAAPGYFLAKQVIRLIDLMSKKIALDANVSAQLRLIFLENYNATRAEVVIPAADLSEQISCAGMEASGTGNMKLAMNGALTIGTEDGANIEIHREVTDEWWPFSFGHTAEENRQMHKSGSYDPWDTYHKYPYVQKAVDALKDHSLASNEEEHQLLLTIYRSLLEGPSRDNFFVLRDLPSYYEAQKKVEELYAQPLVWARYAIENIARMGYFSSDRSINDYAKLVWGLLPCPVDKEELQKVREQYSEHDKCRILSSSNGNSVSNEIKIKREIG